MAMQSSPSSFSYDYDVFLSFRGSDTRYGFSGNLYRALVAKGIRTFIDDRELHGGEEITQSLIKAIRNSMIAIPVFSVNYASSSFCLDELVHIMDSFMANNRLVLPVFFGIQPTNVRHQTGSYAEAIAKHEKRFQNKKENDITESLEKLQKWKSALTQAANLSGYHFNPGKEYEYKFIENIVHVVSNTINRTPLHVEDYLVGLEPRVLQVKSLLKMGSDVGVSILGIHGMGGIGKTTLAREIYNSIANQFEVLCFLDAVKEKTQKLGLVHLQETLLYETIGERDIKLGSTSKGISIIKQRLQNQKVLLILDDVDDLKQLQVMIGEPCWLGPGSRVIVTTRDAQLLASHGIETTYEVEGLNEREALELLRCKVSKINKVDSSYEQLLKRVVIYASGLPLALEVVGSIFSKKKHREERESLLSRYEKIPHKDIQKILEVSYDALEKEEKSVFLDISCCFKGYELGEVERILYAYYGECMKCHIKVLVEKSLIKIRLGILHTHDLIETMGKEIVRQESPEKPGKRSRLWFHEDIVEVLEDNTGESQIKMMHLNFPFSQEKEEKEIEWNGDELKKMKNIKTIIIKNGRFSKAPEHIPNSLRVLEWHRYPSSDLPYGILPKKLSMCKLIEGYFRTFELPSSFKKFMNIREINLDYCENLREIHDVSGLSNLEKISFEGCKNLTTIHDSMGSHLNKLKRLNAENCSKLQSFPPLKLTSLDFVELSGCNNLKSFPEILGEMEKLTFICLFYCSIDELPFSFRNLVGLTRLTLCGSGTLRLSSTIVMMPKLTWIYVDGYSQLLLKHDDDPSSMVSSNVRSIKICDCKPLNVFLPMLITWFTRVTELDLSWGKFTILPEFLKECCSLNTLIVDWCESLQEIRGIPSNLKTLSAESCYSLSSSCRRMLLSQICVDVFINGCEYHVSLISLDHSYLLDLQLELQDRTLKSKLEKEFLENEWIHAEVRFQFYGAEDQIRRSALIESGIHVLKQQSSLNDIQFTDPYKKTNSGEDFDRSMRTRFCLRVQRLKLQRLRVQQRMNLKGSIIGKTQTGNRAESCVEAIKTVSQKMQSFHLDKHGKKYYMLYARDLTISWSDTPQYWSWRSFPKSRFKEVALLLHVWWFGIGGKINTRVLSSNTQYTAFLVFKLMHNVSGFHEHPVELSVGRLGGQCSTKRGWLKLENEENDQLERPKVRSDGWLEIEMGEFFNSGLEDKEVEMSALEIKSLKCGFLLAGIEIRPKE